jgi:hypothetical protein
VTRLLVLLLASTAAAGCGSSSSSESNSESSKTPAAKQASDRTRAARAWRRYIRPKARADAADSGAQLVKLRPSIDNPQDYGQGFRQAVGTAYAEVETPSGFRGGLIYSAELRNTGGAWHVQPGSLEEKKP